MSTSESKKTKRRKIKNAVTKSSASSNVFFSNAGISKLEQLLKGNEDIDSQSLPADLFLRGANPFMKEHCLLCECERIDPPDSDKLKSGSGDIKSSDTDAIPKLPLWVCPACRKAADSELINKQDEDIPFLDQEPENKNISFPFLSDINLESNEPTTPNGTMCFCEACKERRQIADEFNKETQELQRSWVDLRKVVQAIYNSDDPYLSEPDSIEMRDLVVKLCSRDPHQLFLSPIRDFVIEKRVRLNQQLNKGYSSPSDAQLFIHMYTQLCRASRVASECLADLLPESYPCQCHLCLPQPPGHLLNSGLPQHVPLSPRQTDLHIYPHIHGYPGLHGLQGRNHPRSSILTPQLYDLHTPMPQTKLTEKIDFDSTASMPDHLYPAFGDWDNDPHGLLGSHQYSNSFPSDLLPPPPLTANNPFITDPLLLPSQQTTTPVSAPPNSAFKTVAHTHTPNTDLTCSSAFDAVHFDTCAKSTSCSAATSQSTGVVSKHQGTRPVTLGGNSTSAPSTTCTDKSHTHCMKHNHQLDKSAPMARNQTRINSHNQHQTPDLLQNNTKHNGKDEAAGKSRNGNGGTTVPHSCSHGNKGHKQDSCHLSYVDNHQLTCPNSVSLPTSINNVSVGTSTLCTYPDCEGNHDDNCDSIDDTCSDKSSSTSSNQKEGKYCDCCYCEFFGHGNQPVSQTSKKYTEMKEKLRRRLKHRSEARPEDVIYQLSQRAKQREEKNERRSYQVHQWWGGRQKDQTTKEEKEEGKKKEGITRKLEGLTIKSEGTSSKPEGVKKEEDIVDCPVSQERFDSVASTGEEGLDEIGLKEKNTEM